MVDLTARRRVARKLARYSFADPDRAADMLCCEPLSLWDAVANTPVDSSADQLLAVLGRAADPDAALAGLADLVAAEAHSGLRSALCTDQALRARLICLLGVSIPLAKHLAVHPLAWQALVGDYDVSTVPYRLSAAVGALVEDPVVGTAGSAATVPDAEAIEALRDAYRWELIAIAGRDLAGEMPLPEVAEKLADLAGHTLQVALAVARGALGDAPTPCRLAVIAMGKTGGRELNYLSDVDVVFVAEPGEGADGTAAVDSDAALRTASSLAREMMRVCHAVAWEVDAALRPEGKDGPLVRTLASHEAYYRRWASTWEFQALLKARPIAGDLTLGCRYAQVISPFVWTAAERADFIVDVRAMRRRVVEHIPSGIVGREIKLGPGGLRDVEFAVQLLQLVHGRGDETLRVAATLSALAALRDGGYVGRDDALRLDDAYRFLRASEHRLQLHKLRRTHLVPEGTAGRLWLGRAMGYRPDDRGDARAVWEAEWAQRAHEVRRLHEKLFYRPLLEAVARVPSAALRLTPAEASRRLEALGFDDPSGALRHIESMTSGVSRRAMVQRALLPVMLSDFADAPDPDRGLLAYRQVSDQLGSTPWYLRLLRDEGAVASRLAQLLGTSRYIARILVRAPEALQMLADDAELRPRDGREVLGAMTDSAARQSSTVDAVAVIRGVRRHELLRTAFADLLGRIEAVEVCEAISEITVSTICAVLAVAQREVLTERELTQLPVRFAVIAMGRLGGAEVSYGSDADVMFVYTPSRADDPDAGRIAHDIAGKLRSMLSSPASNDQPLPIDADLRPEGRNGPLVRTLASYRQYYQRWSSPWEAQALLRARFVAGDATLGAEFIDMVDEVRYPAAGISPADLIEIRRLKGRVDDERLPRGADPSTHTKLGRGGLTDIEWTIQLIQLEYAAKIPELRTTRTLPALDAAAANELLSAADVQALGAAWRSATAVRSALMLVRDKPADQLPTQGATLVGLARALGYPPEADPGQVVDDYRRAARRARRVVERVFYGPLM